MTAPRDRAPAVLGTAALGFFAAHAGQYLVRGQPEQALWACHVGSALVGLGLLLRRPSLNAVGTVWLLAGLPLWLYDLSRGGEFIPTSILTHGGGLIVGLFGARRLGVPTGLWWKVLLGLAPLYALSRWLTPPEANVNLSQRIHPGSEPYFPSYPFYVASLAVLFGASGLGFQGLTRRLGWKPPEPA